MIVSFTASVPCPQCGGKVPAFSVMNVRVNKHNLRQVKDDRSLWLVDLSCPECKAEVRHVEPFTASDVKLSPDDEKRVVDYRAKHFRAAS